MQKVAVVTGSYQGIGRGIADALKAAGYKVVYSDVHESMEGELYCKCDISKAADRENLADFVERECGRIDRLVNNAGVACKVRLDILETTEESFDRVVGINTKGTFFMCQTFANRMIAEQGKNDVSCYRLPMRFDKIYGVTSNGYAVLGNGTTIYLMNLN